MNYILKKQKSPILPSVGMYVARTVHNEVVDTEKSGCATTGLR